MAEIASQTSNFSVPSMEEISAGLEKRAGRSEEQHAFIDAMQHFHSEGYTSSSAARESVVKFFPSESLLHHSSLKSPLLYMNVRSILNRNGIRVARRQGLPVYQAVSSAIYENDETLRTAANHIMSEWRHSRSGADSTATTTYEASVGGRSRNDTESAWRRAESSENPFPESQKYSAKLGETLTS